MVRVNKHTLSEKHLTTLFDRMNKSIGSFQSKQVDVFLQEFLGPEERLMLAKRLAAIVMLVEGCSLYRTAQTLKLSPATAKKVRQRLDQGSYNKLVSLLKKRKRDYRAILDTLDSILHVGGIMPHYSGLDRYRSLK